MTTKHAIEILGLTQSYGDHAVLKGVDLRVPAGTIFALLGSNGAGKTTMVKILSTLLRADGGTATVNGYDVAAQPARVRESISLTGQFAAVDEILTGRENLVLVAQLRRLEDAGRHRRRPARSVRADRRGRAAGGDLLRRHAPSPRHRHEPDRQPTRALPRRADDRARPAVADRGLEDGAGARRPRHDGAAHHAVPRRGRAPRGPDRGPPRGPDHRQRHSRRAQAAAPADRGRVRREAADPRGHLPRDRRPRRRRTSEDAL